ncbi:MAG: V-type ATP synthase subunit D, partial [Firmicutes bacterium]|nr:V-type ATP synthase subunit D [Bacillota bacterium]
MANVKLTKNELKTQKDHLKQYERYLPTLQLKKQQLQSVIMKVRAEHEKVEEQRRSVVSGLDDWIAVFGENESFADDHKLQKLVLPDRVEYTTENIAGVEVPNFRELTFKDIDYSVDDYP